MSKFKDITAQRFGKLTAVFCVKIPKRAPMYWHCRCDCGNDTVVSGTSLRSGRSTSCGCNINQSDTIKFKKQNPNASEQEIMKERIRNHTKWNGECLEWTATLSNGYGTFEHKGKCMNASRAAWIAQYGEPPKGMCVCHHCDNRKCCRVSHMFLGTHGANTIDMIMKGRDNWETCRKFPVGTREKVWELRQSGKLYREICVELSLTMDQVKSLLQNHKNKLKNKE